jgi:hypothetical protein
MDPAARIRTTTARRPWWAHLIGARQLRQHQGPGGDMTENNGLRAVEWAVSEGRRSSQPLVLVHVVRHLLREDEAPRP